MLIVNDHYFNHARQVASANFNERPQGCDIDLLVLHSISLPPGHYGGSGVEALFTNSLNPAQHPYFAKIAELRVSAHLFVRRAGDLVQFVPFNKRAWHAGVSSYQGRDNCNDFSIGIELEGTDTDTFTLAQYDQLARVIVCLCATYPGLRFDRIVGHEHIAPGRKTDPGSGFDWQRLYTLLRKLSPTD
jgi:AmpD protein